MIVNALLVLGVFVLLAYAWGRRPGPLVLSVSVALVVSLVLIAALEKRDALSALLAVDAGLVAAMAHLALDRSTPQHIAGPAKIIMIVGTLKIAFALSGALLDLNHNTRAATRNGAFVIQILVAGGMLDGLIAWLGHRSRLLGARARRVLHRLEGE
ncbi:hypothetical protein [Novosphingobium sp.]|uniref:hypothetical protein n=1 Tax=Novosphingobium sp. TaxID=1874826 RepID=UPI00286E6704|nr:hypothetical protein [Novosphingobium sp.]